MLLKHLQQDTFVEKVRVTEPKISSEQLCAVRIKNRRYLFCFLILANIIVLNTVCGYWTAEKDTPIWKMVLSDNAIHKLWTKGQYAATSRKPANKFGVVTGIVFNRKAPMALINDQVVNEGDTLGGIKIVKINRDEVQFEKNGKMWTQGVRQKPNSAW